MSMMARLQWPLDSSKLGEPLTILRNYNGVLNLMLAVLQVAEGRRAAYAAFRRHAFLSMLTGCTVLFGGASSL